MIQCQYKCGSGGIPVDTLPSNPILLTGDLCYAEPPTAETYMTQVYNIVHKLSDSTAVPVLDEVVASAQNCCRNVPLLTL